MPRFNPLAIGEAPGTPGPWEAAYHKDAAIVRQKPPRGQQFDSAFHCLVSSEFYASHADGSMMAASREMFDALRDIAMRIDRGSGTAHWTAREHDQLVKLLIRAVGETP